MGKKLFKIIPLLLVTLMTASGYCAYKNSCDPCDPCDPCQKEDVFEQGHSADKAPIHPGYNHPARVDTECSWDCYISGSFIYWQPRQRGMEFARHWTIPVTNTTDYTLVELDFDFKPGFKVGLGFGFDNDDWILDFEYTRLHSKHRHNKTLNSAQVALGNEGMEDFWKIHSETNYEYYARSVWKFKYDMIDGTLGRAYYVGKNVSFKPYFGVRGGWIRQKNRLDYTDIDTGSVEQNEVVHAKSHSWLVGPRVGIDSSWHLGEGFRIFGNTAGSLFYQYFKTRVENQIPVQSGVTTATTYKASNNEGFFNPNFDTSIGLAWGDYFYDASWHVDIAVEYEFHIFWDQNMMRKLVDYVNYTADPTAGDLMLHGLTVSLKLDF